MTNTSTLTVSSQKTSVPNIFTQQVKTLLGSPVPQKQMPQPGIVEIARSLWGDDSPHITIDEPQELIATQGLLVGTAMATITLMWVWQDMATGITLIDTVMTSMSLMSLGSAPMAVNHPMPALEVHLHSN